MLAAARDGNRGALEALVTAHYDRVHALCRRMLGNEPDALDATQDTLVAALRALDRFDGRSAFGTWLYRIATNTCIDEMRRRQRRPVIGIGADVAEVADELAFGAPGLFVTPPGRGADRSGASDASDASDGPEMSGGNASPRPNRGGNTAPSLGGAAGGGSAPDPADVAAARIDIDAALASLPLEFRTAVVLRDVCDLPYDEISDILGVPVGTVRSRIARARSALAATWRSDESEHVAGDPITARSDGNSSDPSIVKTADDDRRGATPSGRSQEEERTP